MKRVAYACICTQNKIFIHGMYVVDYAFFIHPTIKVLILPKHREKEVGHETAHNRPTT